MVCIYCGKKTKVVNSRIQKRIGNVWRRRACTSCGAVFTTLESPELTSSLRVRYIDGSLVPFERDRLMISLAQSLGHRTDAVASARALTDTVLNKIIPEAKSAVIDRATIISLVINTLRHFDDAAATYYAAYHQ